MKFLIPEEKKENGVLKIVLISAGVTVAIIGILLVLKKFFCPACCCDDCDCDCCECTDECDCEAEEKCDCCDCVCEETKADKSDDAE